MKVIANSGMEEILILTGESRGQSNVEYIGEEHKCNEYQHFDRSRPSLSVFLGISDVQDVDADEGDEGEGVGEDLCRSSEHIAAAESVTRKYAYGH